MAEIAGKTSKVYVHTAAMNGTTGAELKGMDTNSFNQMVDMLDITSFGDSFKKSMPGIKDTAIDVSGNLYTGDTTGQVILKTAYDNGTTVFIGIHPQGTGVAGTQVECYVSGLATSATTTGKQTFTPKFTPIAAPVAMPLRS